MVSSLTFKKTKPSEESAICGHLLNYSNISSFKKFNFLADGNNKFVFENKENLRIKLDKPSFFLTIVSILVVSLYSYIVLL